MGRKDRDFGDKYKDVSVSGLSREELFERTDRLRQQMLDYLTKHGTTNVRTLGGVLKVSYDMVRSYGAYLDSIGAVTKTKIKLDTFYTATGVPYKVQRKSSRNNKGKSELELNNAPHLRVIRLLDRKPNEISKAEHQLNKRNQGRSIWGSSMSMFDGY